TAAGRGGRGAGGGASQPLGSLGPLGPSNLELGRGGSVPSGGEGGTTGESGARETLSSQEPPLLQRGVGKHVERLPRPHVAAMARGDRVELRGFGAFSVKNRPARTGRNPRTGAHVSVDKKSVPFFKTGKEMRERLNRPSS